MSLKLNSKIQARKRVLANKHNSFKNKIEDQSEDEKNDSVSDTNTNSGNLKRYFVIFAQKR